MTQPSRIRKKKTKHTKDTPVKSDAIISGDYRYALWRIWDDKLPMIMFIGLNPSTADASKDDNTIRRCVGYAKEWNYGGLSVGNLFAFRSTKPEKLREAKDPIGPENDRWLNSLKAEAKMTVAVWGNNGTYLRRDQAVLKIFPDLYCLKLSVKGIPCHPLYLPRTLKPFKLIDEIKRGEI